MLSKYNKKGQPIHELPLSGPHSLYRVGLSFIAGAGLEPTTWFQFHYDPIENLPRFFFRQFKKVMTNTQRANDILRRHVFLNPTLPLQVAVCRLVREKIQTMRLDQGALYAA